MKPINPPHFTEPKAPFSYAVIAQSKSLVFVSGQAAIDLTTGEFHLSDIKHETELTLRNIQRVLESAGTDLAHVVKCTIYLRDINDFAAMNEIYRQFFPHEGRRPARTTVQAMLGSNIKVEIDAIAELP